MTPNTSPFCAAAHHDVKQIKLPQCPSLLSLLSPLSLSLLSLSLPLSLSLRLCQPLQDKLSHPQFNSMANEIFFYVSDWRSSNGTIKREWGAREEREADRREEKAKSQVCSEWLPGKGLVSLNGRTLATLFVWLVGSREANSEFCHTCLFDSSRPCMLNKCLFAVSNNIQAKSFSSTHNHHVL